jgi:hypothetical protein
MDGNEDDEEAVRRGFQGEVDTQKGETPQLSPQLRDSNVGC